MWRIEARAETSDEGVVERISADLETWARLSNLRFSWKKENLDDGGIQAASGTGVTVGLVRDDQAPAVPAADRPWVRPAGVLGVSVPGQFVLARDDDVAVAVWGLVAFPTGFRFTVVAVCRHGPLPLRRMLLRRPEPAPEFVRIGVSCADGTSAGNLDLPPARRVLVTDGGQTAGDQYIQSYFCWPRPPPGAIVFSCQWPAFGIETEHRFDAQPIIEAAASSPAIWPDS